jgi:signal peptidase I
MNKNKIKTTIKIIIISIIFGLSFLNFTEKLNKNLIGRKFFIISSESMSPLIPKGSIVVTKPVKSFEIGKIIVFRNPTDTNLFIMHRLVGFEYEGSVKYLITKGDKNVDNDPWLLDESNVSGEIVFSAPLLGSFIDILRKPLGLILLILVPSGYVIFSEIEKIGNEFKNITYFKKVSSFIKGKLKGYKIVKHYELDK